MLCRAGGDDDAGDDAGGEADAWTTYEGPARARWEYDKQIALALAEGYRRTPGSAPAEEARHPELEAAITADPDAEEAYLVYADWLQGRGDPRGELICVQHALAEQRRHDRDGHHKHAAVPPRQLERAEALMLMIHGARLHGPALAQIDSVEEQRYLVDLFELSWRLGFIRGAARGRSLARQDDNRALWPAVLASPSARFLRQLTLDWYDCDQLQRVELPQTLHRLELVLERWWPPAREADSWDADRGRRSLEETLGPAEQFAPEVIGRLQPLLQHPQAPGLRELVLQRCPFSRALLGPLLASPLLTQLSTLDLSHGTLADADVPLLLEAGAALRRLQRLDLRRNKLGLAARDRLLALGGFVKV